MNARIERYWFAILAAGDLLTIALVTIYGFASHNELSAGATRMLTTFLPLTIAWLAAAPFLGAYDRQRAMEVRQLWRPFWVMLLAAPLAAWLRGVWLNAPILPLFVFILGGVSALAILIWRGCFALIVRRMSFNLKS
jgi:hypothetical protein